MSRSALRLAPWLLVAVLASGCSSSYGGHSASAAAPAAPAAEVAPAPAAAPAPAGKVHKLASGLVYEDLVVGSGTMAEPGLTVSMQYTGWLTDGTKFDSSLDHGGQPYTFSLGAGRVVAGWDEGIKGMRVGGKRKLTIPPDLGYGAQGTPGGPIPPNATLVFEVELVDVK